MNHLHWMIDANEGDTVEVVIDRAANVQLLDPANYEHYQHGREFGYQGGYSTVSPVLIPVPHAGRWHVVVDLGGGPGRVRASVNLLAESQA